MTDATNTPEGFARIGFFDRLEAVGRIHALTDEGIRAIQLKRDLIASAFGAKETAAAADFLTKFEVQQSRRSRPI